MKFTFNDSRLKQRRQGLRRNQTDFERIIWSRLKNRQCSGLRFFRQYSVGAYILDFYCPKLQLAIEIDGGQHSESKEYDQIRTEYLKAHNITELRFWNNEVINN